MKVWEFEARCWSVDAIRVVIRAPVETVIGAFSRKNSAIGTRTATWYRSQLLPLIGNHEFAIINGNGAVPNGNTQLDTVRQSYS